MTLQSTGAISLGNVATELGRAAGTTTSLGEAAVRNLAGVASGPISMSSLYGKSNESFWHASLGTTVFNYRMLGTDSSGNIYACASSVVLKWSRDGALLWAKTVSGPFFSGGCVDASGNVYLAGGYYSSNYYAYLLKLDTGGTLQWQRSLNGSAQEYWCNAAVDASGRHARRTSGYGTAAHERPSPSSLRRPALRSHGSSRTGKPRRAQSSAVRTRSLFGRPPRAASGAHGGEPYRSRPRILAPATSRTAGSASAVRAGVCARSPPVTARARPRGHRAWASAEPCDRS